MGQFRVWAVFLTVVFALHIVLSKRKSLSEVDLGFFDCLVYQNCVCGNSSSLRGCYYLAKEETRQKLLDVLNVCKQSNITFHLEMTEMSIVQELCKFDAEESRECYRNGTNDLLQYMKAVSLNPFKIHVTAAMERARLCISPAVVGCLMYGTETC